MQEAHPRMVMPSLGSWSKLLGRLGTSTVPPSSLLQFLPQAPALVSPSEGFERRKPFLPYTGFGQCFIMTKPGQSLLIYKLSKTLLIYTLPFCILWFILKHKIQMLMSKYQLNHHRNSNHTGLLPFVISVLISCLGKKSLETRFTLPSFVSFEIPNFQTCQGCALMRAVQSKPCFISNSNNFKNRCTLLGMIQQAHWLGFLLLLPKTAFSLFGFYNLFTVDKIKFYLFQWYYEKKYSIQNLF